MRVSKKPHIGRSRGVGLLPICSLCHGSSWPLFIDKGVIFGIDRFGMSAPAADIAKVLGFTPEAVAKLARRQPELQDGQGIRPMLPRTKWHRRRRKFFRLTISSALIPGDYGLTPRAKPWSCYGAASSSRSSGQSAPQTDCVAGAGGLEPRNGKIKLAVLPLRSEAARPHFTRQ